MTAAIITLALCLAVAVLSGVLVMRWGMKAKNEAGLAGDRLREQARVADEALMSLANERDDLKQKLDVATRQLVLAKAAKATAEIQRNTAMREGVAHAVQAIRSSGAATGAASVNAILSSPLPVMPKADSAGTEDGDSETVGLPPP